MKLYSSPLSPYVRKVRVTAGVKGLTSKIEMVAADTNAGDPDLNRHNPLGKIPCLVADGQAIFDSHVICEYLDSIGTGPVLFPRSGPGRWKMLTEASLANGVIDAALLLVYEKRFRPEDKHVAAWTDRQWAKVNGAIAHFEKSPPTWGAHPDFAHITLACALGYLDFRHDGKWRAGHPKLVVWLDRFSAAVPAFVATTPKA